MTIDRFFELGLLATLLSSIWIAFVLALRVPVARWLGARWAYCLWLLPLLGILAMMIPTHPFQRVFDLPSIEIPAVSVVVGTASEMLDRASGSSGDVGNATRFIHTEDKLLLLVIWFLGAIWSLARFAHRNIRYSIDLRGTSRNLNSEEAVQVSKRCGRLFNRPLVTLRMLPTVHGPAVVGLVRPVLFLPVDFFQRFGERQQSLILAHEYRHLVRYDLVSLLFVRIFRCLFWFNPLVYVGERYLQLDLELSVDENLLADSCQATRRQYGESLLLSAHGGSSFAQLGYASAFGDVRKRAYMLKHYRQRMLGSLLGGLLLSVSVVTSVAYGVLGSLGIEPDRDIRESLQLSLDGVSQQLRDDETNDDARRALLGRLTGMEDAYQGQALNRYELARLHELTALAHYQLGNLDRAIQSYQEVVSLTPKMPELRSAALEAIARLQFRLGNYQGTVQALARAENIGPSEATAMDLALRGRAYIRLHQWNEGLDFIDRAIRQAESTGEQPPKDWMLLRTSLQWKLGDLAAAAHSLQETIELYPGSSYEQTLAVFNESLQEVWVPEINEDSPARF